MIADDNKCFQNPIERSRSNATVQQFNNTAIQQYNNSTVQQFNNTTIQQYSNSTVQQFNNTTIQQFKSDLANIVIFYTHKNKHPSKK